MFVEKGSAILTPEQVEELRRLASAAGPATVGAAEAFADLAAAVKRALEPKP